MPDLINWYLTELRLRLQKGFSGERLDGILREAESHLRESAKRIYESGQVTEEAATQAALQAYGTPERVATTYLSRSNPKLFGLNPMWSVMLGGLIAIACWDFHWLSLSGFFDNFGETWENGLAGFIGFVALIVLGVGCARGYRRFRLPLLSLGLGTALFLVPFLSFLVVGTTRDHQGLSRMHLSRDVARVKQTLAKLEAYKGYYARGASAFSTAKSVADLAPEFTDGSIAAKELGLPKDGLMMDPEVDQTSDSSASFVMPYNSIFAEVDGRIWGIETTSNFLRAKKQWQVQATRNAASADVLEREFQGLLRSAEEAQSGRLFFFNRDVYSDAVAWTIVFIPGLLLIESVVSGGMKRRKYWPGRAIA